MKRIKIFIYEPYVFKIYGNLTFLLFLFSLHDRNKFEFIFVTPFECDYLDKVRALDIRCIVVPVPQILREYGGKTIEKGLIGKIFTGFAIFKYSYNIVKLIKKERIDIIHCNSIRAAITVGLASKLTITPIVWYIKGELENSILDRIGFLLARKILFLCESLKLSNYSFLIKYFGSKISTLSLGIDLYKISEVERYDLSGLKNELGHSSYCINIAFVGVVSALKGVDNLVLAMGKVKKDVPNVKLYIIGDYCIDENKGFKGELDNIIIKNNLENYIYFTGWREDVMEIISLMDFLVLPSRSEGFGRCIVEGMAIGKPAIGSNVGGIPDAIKHNKTGLIVEPNNPQKLADAIIKLAHDKELRQRLGAAARKEAFEKYSIQKNIEGLEKVYRELAGTAS